jgi:hypothetical protein
MKVNALREYSPLQQKTSSILVMEYVRELGMYWLSLNEAPPGNDIRAETNPQASCPFPQNLLRFYFTVYKRIIACTTDTYIVRIAAHQGVITSAAQDAVISTSPIDNIRACTADDQVVRGCACECARASDDIAQVYPSAGGRFDVFSCDRNGLLPSVRSGHTQACCKCRNNTHNEQGEQPQKHKLQNRYSHNRIFFMITVSVTSVFVVRLLLIT